MKNAEKYFQALREAVGEEKFPLAVAQLKMTGEELFLGRRLELTRLRSSEARMELLNKWFGHFLAPEVKNFIVILAGENKLDALDGLEHGDGARNEAVVRVARELSPETKRWLEAELNQIFGRGLTVCFQEDKNLIGGVRIKIGDKEVDNSIRAKLAAIMG